MYLLEPCYIRIYVLFPYDTVYFLHPVCHHSVIILVQRPRDFVSIAWVDGDPE